MDACEFELGKKNFCHFKKINLFGLEGVGKSCLITLLDSYQKKEDENQDDEKEEEEENKEDEEKENKEGGIKLVQKIKKVYLPVEKGELYLNIYETRIISVSYIINNIEDLILDSQCIIFMYVISSKDTYTEI